MLATISDSKTAIDVGGNGTIDYYQANVLTASDYYPFGMQMPGRTFNGGNYRFGFNGQEMSNEIKGLGNSYTAMYWEYDSRIGRRWNLDPRPMVGVSEYSAFGNNPIVNIDPLGDTLSNPQLLAAARLASNEIKDAVKNKRGFFVQGTNSRLLGAAEKYIKENDLNFGDASDFISQVGAYHDGLASVAMNSAKEFEQLDRSVINNDKLTSYQALKITIGYIHSSDAELRNFLNISANVALGEAAGGVGGNVGKGPRAPFKSSLPPPPGKDLAFGISDNLNEFSQATGFKNYRQFTSGGFKRDEILSAIKNPNNRLHFNLEGFQRWKYMKYAGNPVAPSPVLRNITNWELHTIYNTPGALQRTTFYKIVNGSYQTVPKPF